MKIDLNNYEEYFLMYADNELSAADRACVERFVNENPSVAEELELIKATILQPEAIYLSNKGDLKKNIEFEITAEEEKLNLYLDKELSLEEAGQFEKSIINNEELSRELAIYKRAISTPDLDIVFPNKENLHRHERKVIPIYLMRVAAAAMILGLGFWVGSMFISKSEVHSNGSSIVAQVVPDKTVTGNEPTEQKSTSVPSITDDQSSDKTDEQTAGEEVSSDKKQPNEDHAMAVNNITPATNDNVDKDITNSIIEPEKTSSGMITQQLAVSEEPIATQEHPLKMSLINNNNIKPVSYVEQDINNDDEDKNFPEKEFRKSKLGVFLKKASRTLSRNLKGVAND